MWRRLYFTFPHAEHARRVVAELERDGVNRNRIHTIARPDVDLSGLPIANEAQRKDRVWFWERTFWNGNLIFFAIMLAIAALTLYAGSPGWTIVALAAALAAVVLGERFAVKVPHVHLSEMRVPMIHGEVIIMVDVPRTRVRDIEQMVIRHHPEAGVGGVGWTLASAGI